MSGIIEQLMGKMDTLIESLNENTKVRLAGGVDAAATTDKPKTTRKPAAEKPAETKPSTSETDLVAKFDAIKAINPEVTTPALKKIIQDQGFTSLKELRMAPAKFDATMAALLEYEATLSAGGADEDDDL